MESVWNTDPMKCPVWPSLEEARTCIERRISLDELRIERGFEAMSARTAMGRNKVDTAKQFFEGLASVFLRDDMLQARRLSQFDEQAMTKENDLFAGERFICVPASREERRTCQRCNASILDLRIVRAMRIMHQNQEAMKHRLDYFYSKLEELLED